MANKIQCEVRRYYINEVGEKIAYAVLKRDGKTACSKYIKSIENKNQPKGSMIELVELKK